MPFKIQRLTFATVDTRRIICFKFKKAQDSDCAEIEELVWKQGLWRVRLDDLYKSLPTQIILRFYEKLLIPGWLVEGFSKPWKH